MKKEMTKIFVKDIQSGHILFECPLELSEQAYELAASMEKMGLDIEVINPTLSETLSQSLGLSSEDIEEYQNSIDDEIKSHDESCCVSLSSKPIG